MGFTGSVRTSKVSWLGVAMVVMLLLASCSSAQPGSSAVVPSLAAARSPAPTATPTPQPVPLKLAINGNAAFSNLAAIYAVKEGLLAKRGYLPELVAVPNDTTGIQGLLAGSFSIVTQGVSAAMTAAAQGAPLVLVDSICPLVDYQFLARPGINSMKELEGKNVGISSPGSIADQVSRAVLAKQGVDVNKVQFVAVGADPDRAKAISAGKIDGAVVNSLQTFIAMKADPSLHILLDVGKELSAQFLNTGVVTTKDVAAKQPKLVQDVVSALIEASRILQTRATLVDYAIKQGMPADAVGAAFDLLNKSAPYLPVNGGLSQTAFDFTVQALKANGQLQSSISWTDMADTKFVEAAVKELGPYTK